jgi:hypothetical protein
MQLARPDTTRWWVVFSDLEPAIEGDEVAEPDRLGRAVRWALRTFLKPGFRHVFCMRRAENFDGWVIIDPTLSVLRVIEVSGADYVNRVVVPLVQSGRVHVAYVPATHTTQFGGLPPLTCVQTVARILGRRVGAGATPWRLYRHLTAEQEAP